jgi:hypothetical protein
MYQFDEEAELVAGRIAPPGCYVRVDVRSGRRIILERPEPLPASLDGQVAVYQRLATLSPRLSAVGAASSTVAALD